MKKILIFFFMVLTMFPMHAQKGLEDTIARVLLVPFDRFELHMEFKLEKINKINGLEKDQYYPELVKEFTNAFLTQTDQAIVYHPISDLDGRQFKFSATYQYQDKEIHYACDLSSYNMKEYQELLDKYGCQKLLVVTWCKISEVKEKMKNGKVQQIGPYSEFLIDYDFFDYEKNLLQFEASKVFRAPANKGSMSTQGLLIRDLVPAFTGLVQEINAEIVETKGD